MRTKGAKNKNADERKPIIRPTVKRVEPGIFKHDSNRYQVKFNHILNNECVFVDLGYFNTLGQAAIAKEDYIKSNPLPGNCKDYISAKRYLKEKLDD